MTKILTTIGVVIILTIIGIHENVAADSEPYPETIDGFALLDKISAVIQKYGQPSLKKRRPDDPNEDSFCETYKYNQKGITFEVCNGEIEEIEVYSKSTVKTSKSIGIGSTKTQVIKSYGKPGRSTAKYIDYPQGEVIIDPCLTFWLRNGKVSGITLSSSMAGCESQ